MAEIVVSMTSWKRRINNVSRTIVSLLKNTVQPRSIELNLSEEEFPNKEKELPEELMLLVNAYPININWVGKNTKAFKKIIPTIKKYWEEKDLYLFSADDDVIYQPNILESFIEVNKQNPNNCVCFGRCAGTLNGQQVVRGGATLYKIGFFTELVWEGLTDQVIATNEDDWWYSYCFLKTGGRKCCFTGVKLKFYNAVAGHGYNTQKTKRLLMDMIRKNKF